MNNYTYIISSLPVINEESGKNIDLDPERIVGEIREQLDGRDQSTLDLFLKGFEADNLCEGFYREALSHSNRFIREYYAFDLNVRNAKARFINEACGRPASQDTIALSEDESDSDFEQSGQLDQILHRNDILAREKGLDDLMWEHIGELTVFNYFDMDSILAFTAKLNIVERWLKLDAPTGREMFRTLVGEIRSTFKGVEY